MQALLKREGITDNEFSELRQAKVNSDALVATELIAMDAVEGIISPGASALMIPGEDNLGFARRILHDRGYHEHKAAIMKPLDRFFVLLDGRTRREIDIEYRGRFFLMTILVLLLIQMILLAVLIVSHSGAGLLNRLSITAKPGSRPYLKPQISDSASPIFTAAISCSTTGGLTISDTPPVK
jgi:hypothetical protein